MSFFENPHLTLLKGATELIATNDDWWSDNIQSMAVAMRAALASVGHSRWRKAAATPAMVRTLQPGSYSVQVSSADGTTGIALVEIYEVP